MNRLLSILLLFCVYSHLYAQPPYDSFSPATSRPILDVVQDMDANKDSLQQTQMDIAIATTDDVSKWLSPDPLSDKYPEISPYAYCHWNPVKYVDKDGRDDLFDESGTYIEHINNGTDYVMIQKMNGEQQNITEFSYSKNELANREMLSNVATYYAAQVNLSQDIGIFDNTTIEEGAFACTLSEKRQVSMVVSNGKLSSLANTGSNIMNAFVHETKHAIDGVKSEIDAILQQIEHPTWSKTTDAFQLGVINYLVNNANDKKLSSGNPSIKRIQSILEQSTYSIYHHKNEFSISLQLK